MQVVNMHRLNWIGMGQHKCTHVQLLSVKVLRPATVSRWPWRLPRASMFGKQARTFGTYLRPTWVSPAAAAHFGGRPIVFSLASITTRKINPEARGSINVVSLPRNDDLNVAWLHLTKQPVKSWWRDAHVSVCSGPLNRKRLFTVSANTFSK